MGVRRGETEPVALGAPPVPGWGKPYRSVFAQLAEGREGFLVRFAHLLDELPHLGGQRVALRALGLGRLLLLLVSVIPHSCGGQRPGLQQVRAAAHPCPSSSHQTEPLRLPRKSPARGLAHTHRNAHAGVHV